MRFFVRSEADPRRGYIVDLLEHEGRAACSCKHWQTRCWPVIRDGGRSRCKHICASREYFLDQLLETMSAKENQS